MKVQLLKAQSRFLWHHQPMYSTKLFVVGLAFGGRYSHQRKGLTLAMRGLHSKNIAIRQDSCCLGHGAIKHLPNQVQQGNKLSLAGG